MTKTNRRPKAIEQMYLCACQTSKLYTQPYSSAALHTGLTSTLYLFLLILCTC